MDYWGISYKKGLEYILQADPSDTIRVAFENYPGKSNIQILPEKDRNRLLVTEKADADYFLTNYRNHPDDYAEDQSQQWRHIVVDHNTILSVFKLK